jgi:peptidyl-prolyl cis-trans isomerase SurA
MDWLQYEKAVKTSSSPAYPEMMKKYIGVSAWEYYQGHLEDYNADFKYQINEFKEGNLLFEIMEREVWSKAAEDSTGLLKYYRAHREKYKWGPSANAVFFTATDTKAADEAKKKLSAEGLTNWHKLVNNSSGRILGDSGRFDLSQIPLAKGATPSAGMMTPYQINEQDNTVTFTYIEKVFNQAAPRSFEEARGLVINDYQNELEEKWIAQLKKKYPVVINQPVVKSMEK